MNLTESVFRWSRIPGIGRIFYLILKLLGVEFPRAVPVGTGLRLPHGAVGLVVHEQSVIGSNVSLYQGVTLGRSDQIEVKQNADSGGVILEDDVAICAGAKILFRSSETLVVSRGSIIGANAVLTQSTGPNEIWAGVPARLVRTRQDA